MNALKITGKVFAGIYSFLYYFILTGLLVIVFVGKLFSGNYYAKVLNNIDLDTIKIADMGELFEGSGLDEDLSLQDALVYYFTEGGIEEEKAIAIIEDEEIRTMVGEFIGNYLNYSVGGEKPSVSRADVKKLMKNPNIVAIMGKPTEEEIDEGYDNVCNLIDEIIENGGVLIDDSERDNKTFVIGER